MDIKPDQSKELPKQMRAMVYQQYGGPEQLNLRNINLPSPESDELLIKIHASTVNRTDCGFLRADPWVVRLFAGLFKPKAQILGSEFAGEIVAVGADVDKFKLGDRVVAFADDDHGFGGHAEYTTLPQTAMLSFIPEVFDYQQAAPAFEGAHYALHYIRPANIKAGQSVLVNGASGAIGSSQVQIIKTLGARVVAVCGTENVETILELGADRVIDYRHESFELCGEVFDVIFDNVGNTSFFKCKPILKPSAIYASSELGDYSQNPLLALFTKFVGKRKVLFPIPKNLQTDADYIFSLMDKGLFAPLIDRTYTLEQLSEAYCYVEKGMKLGNVVIKVA